MADVDLDNGDVTPYLGLITSEHADKPNFMAMVAAVCQPFADITEEYSDGVSGLYDIDTAVGAQLDIIGQWIGLSRYLQIPLTGVYFSFDMTGLGFDQGVWLGPFDSPTQLVALGDNTYRIILKAKIRANAFDGTIATYESILNQAYGSSATTLHVVNKTGTSYEIYVVGTALPPISLQLLKSDILQLVSAGVTLNGVYAMPGHTLL
jgi:Protein of unknown function (DUF2612)